MGFSWYIKRLGAMSASEIVYRVAQKRLQHSERLEFCNPLPVYEVQSYGKPPVPVLRYLGLNFENDQFTLGRTIDLLGSYPYDEYRMRWHAAFQSEGNWPIRFAYDYSFSAEGVPGDIRTNWELNRHHQLALLAKTHFVTGDGRYLDELSELFMDWNNKNPFLWGPEWSSPMENSIRLVNWLVAAAFLDATEGADDAARDLRDRLTDGAWVMAANIRQHYSRYSSANNHTIVEAVGVGIAATVFGENKWLSEAISLLESEITRQTWSDGVNKEQAFHYQLFVMEALCLLSHVLRTSEYEFSSVLASWIRDMAGYARACSIGEGRYVEFGDDDEGRVLNLSSYKANYPDYVLSLVSLECREDICWVQDVAADETVRWLYPKEELEAARVRPLKPLADIESFPDGGVTILRADGGRIVLAFDHGPLGFGSLAAHGHADALSVQLYVDGAPVLIDPGTYIYNGNPDMRNLFRSTAMHNTVCVDGESQSEMLGPFLWGRKARVGGASIKRNGRAIRAYAFHEGYGAVTHEREIVISDNLITIDDTISGKGCNPVASYHFPYEDSLFFEKEGWFEIKGTDVSMRFSARPTIRAFRWSPRYGRLCEGSSALIPFKRHLVTEIKINKETK